MLFLCCCFKFSCEYWEDFYYCLKSVLEAFRDKLLQTFFLSPKIYFLLKLFIIEFCCELQLIGRMFLCASHTEFFIELLFVESNFLVFTTCSWALLLDRLRPWWEAKELLFDVTFEAILLLSVAYFLLLNFFIFF